MSELRVLNVAERTEFGKGPNRRMRAQGMIPAVFYDQKGNNVAVQVSANALERIYRHVGRSEVFNIEIEKGGKTETYPALVWRVKNDPVKGTPLHVDFFGVDLEKPIKLRVALKLTGRSKGVAKGGKLEVFREFADVQAKPLEIPKSITVDITNLEMGKTLMLSDVVTPEGVELVFKQNSAVVTVVAKGAAAEEEEE